LNDVDVLACDVQNAYMNAKTKEKVWFHGGDNMGTDKGKVVVIVHALYGLKSLGVRWHEHMANTLQNARFKSCLADLDIWFRPAIKLYGTKIYEYVLCHVHDIIFQGLDLKGFMDHLQPSYTLKDGSVKEPDMYLGTDILMYEWKDGKRKAWSLSLNTHVKHAVAEVQRELPTSCWKVFEEENAFASCIWISPRV